MDNQLNNWVQNGLSSLEPPADWEPNVVVARARLRNRQQATHRSRRNWLVATAASAVACAALVMIPATRSLAQQFWQWLTVGRVDVVRVDFDSLPDEAHSLRATMIQKPVGAPARDIQEAASHAGFAPHLPDPGVLAGTPTLSTLSPMSFGTTLRTSDLELALRKAGVSDLQVPREWDGAELVVRIGSSVNAAWPEMGLIQAMDPVIATPQGFDLARFATAILRAAGMDAGAGQKFGSQFVRSPALLFGISMEDKVNIREVRLRSGPATLIEDLDDNGKVEQTALLWGANGRVYILTGPAAADRMIAVADSIQ